MTNTAVSIRPALGFVASGASGAVLIAASARGLAPVGFREISLLWTASTIFGVGLASPAEQAMVRVLSAAEGRVSGPLRMLYTSAFLSIALAGGIGAAGTDSVSVSGLLSWMCVAWGWCLVSPARAAAAGRRQFDLYSGSLFVEAAVRLIFVAAALVGHGGVLMFGLGLGCPLVLAACYLRVATRSFLDPAGQPQPAWVREFGAFVIVSVCFQICLSGPVFFVDWRFGPDGAETVGQFAIASSYLRAPALLAGGLTVQGLARMSLAWARHEYGDVRAVDSRLLIRGAAVAICGAAVGWLSAPLGLPLLYGDQVEIGGGLTAALAVSTCLAMIGAVAVQRLFAERQLWRAAGAWVMGAVVTCVAGGIWVAMAGRLDLSRLGVVLMTGPAAVVALLGAVRRTMNAAGRSGSGDAKPAPGN